MSKSSRRQRTLQHCAPEGGIYGVTDSWQGSALEPVALHGRTESAFEAERRGSVAVITIEGGLSRYPSFWRMFGLSDKATLPEIAAAVRTCAADTSVEQIVLRVDSPGGTVAGTEDVAKAVADAAKLKPVIASVQSLCCSAAYWIASGATQIIAEQTSQLGSVGVYTVVVDWSKSDEDWGRKVHVLRSGDLKGAGVRGSKLTPEQLANWQQSIDDKFQVFEAAVRGSRTLSSKQWEEIARGGDFVGQRALDAGLCDRLMSFDDLMSDLDAGRWDPAAAAETNDEEEATMSLETKEKPTEAAAPPNVTQLSEQLEQLTSDLAAERKARQVAEQSAAQERMVTQVTTDLRQLCEAKRITPAVQKKLAGPLAAMRASDEKTYDELTEALGELPPAELFGELATTSTESPTADSTMVDDLANKVRANLNLGSQEG